MTGPRIYDSVGGRFLQADPMAEANFGNSPYIYASGAPLRIVDPGGYNGTDKVEIPDDSSGDFDWEKLDAEAPPLNGGEEDHFRRRSADFTMDAEQIEEYKAKTWAGSPHTSAARAEAEGRFSNGLDTLVDPQASLKEADVRGRVAADDFLEAQRVREVGELKNNQGLIDAADDIMNDVRGATAIREAAAASGNEVAEAALKSSWRHLGEAGSKLLRRGIPVVSLYFAAETIADAKQLGDQGDYVNAGFTLLSLGYDPVDWGYALAAVRVFATERWSEYQAEQRSRNVHAEIQRLQAQQLGQPWPPPPTYVGPCPSCHY